MANSTKVDNMRETRKEIKEDLSNLKAEMSHNVIVDIRHHATRLTEAERRVNELETVDLRDALTGPAENSADQRHGPEEQSPYVWN